MEDQIDSSLLEPGERPAVRIINAQGAGAYVLICEHFSRFIPKRLHDLGLRGEALTSHVAWDIGAEGLATGLAEGLDAPLVAARVSRLVYDCNRPPDSPGAMPVRSEAYDIPGNVDLSASQRAARIREVYEPFRAAVAETLDTRAILPAVVTVHSFTPLFHGCTRRVQIGILHDKDSRLADAMLDIAERHTDLTVARNDPYGPQDGVTHSLRLHALPRQLPNVMIEVRNDLLGDADACREMADMLAGWLIDAMATLETNGMLKARGEKRA